MNESDFEASSNKEKSVEQTQIFQKYNHLLHFGLRNEQGKKKELLTIPFIKKYIHYARSLVNPVLTQEASDFIAAKYSELRSREDGQQDKYRVRSHFHNLFFIDHANYTSYFGNLDPIVNSPR